MWLNEKLAETLLSNSWKRKQLYLTYINVWEKTYIRQIKDFEVEIKLYNSVRISGNWNKSISR